MTELNKPISRKTSAVRHEKSKNRAVIIVLLPSREIGFRLEGTRETFKMDAIAGYERAVKDHQARIEKRAAQIKKNEMCRISTARSKARKELAGELKI